VSLRGVVVELDVLGGVGVGEMSWQCGDVGCERFGQ